MPVDMVLAAATEAHRVHLPVFAHPQNATGVESAIVGGVDILAHTVPDSPPWTAPLVARLKHAHMALIPTLTLFDVEARKESAPDAVREELISRMVAELKAYSSAGGEVLFGTDVGYTDHFDTSMEYDLMSRAGMTFRQILASLTASPARKFLHDPLAGRIAPGKAADLVVLDADPSAEAKAFANVAYTIRLGQVVYSAGK